MAISEWDQRQLCPDGACVGVIGPGGTCKVCGRVAPDWGEERRRGLVAAEDDATEGDATEGDATEGDGGGDEDEILPSAPAVLGEVAEWQRRRLCTDGACVGVIGPDGHCKVCGKAASAGADEVDIDDGEEDEEDDDEDALAASEDEDEDGDEDEDEDGDEDAAGDGAPADRKLCPDGACIGVIGADGRCKVCGKEAA
jgi:hypothetical protein